MWPKTSAWRTFTRRTFAPEAHFLEYYLGETQSNKIRNDIKRYRFLLMIRFLFDNDWQWIWCCLIGLDTPLNILNTEELESLKKNSCSLQIKRMLLYLLSQHSNYSPLRSIEQHFKHKLLESFFRCRLKVKDVLSLVSQLWCKKKSRNIQSLDDVRIIFEIRRFFYDVILCFAELFI